MGKPHELDRLALWLAMNTEELDIKQFSSGYPYIVDGVIYNSKDELPIVRYAKNYTKDEVKFSLCIITTEVDTKKMEKWLDQQAEEIQLKDIDRSVKKFNMLNVRYKK